MDERDLAKVVEQVKKKDSDALSELYKETHNMAYYMALSILKNEQDALDVVQESYITVFSKLDELNDNSTFASWLKRVVANHCKDILMRKNPELFSSDEIKSDTLENIEDQCENFLPQTYIDQETKREQIMQIINQLSDAKKTAILLFYYNQFSAREISQSLECSVGEVPNKINYAKKYIMSKIEKAEVEKNKQDATIPVPFLRRLFIEEEKANPMPETTAKIIFNNILKMIEFSSN